MTILAGILELREFAHFIVGDKCAERSVADLARMRALAPGCRGLQGEQNFKDLQMSLWFLLGRHGTTLTILATAEFEVT